jgi:hypothetical protein
MRDGFVVLAEQVLAAAGQGPKSQEQELIS